MIPLRTAFSTSKSTASMRGSIQTNLQCIYIPSCVCYHKANTPVIRPDWRRDSHCGDSWPSLIRKRPPISALYVYFKDLPWSFLCSLTNASPLAARLRDSKMAVGGNWEHESQFLFDYLVSLSLRFSGAIGVNEESRLIERYYASRDYQNYMPFANLVVKCKHQSAKFNLFAKRSIK
jgi:hypothetical protein